MNGKNLEIYESFQRFDDKIYFKEAVKIFYEKTNLVLIAIKY